MSLRRACFRDSIGEEFLLTALIKNTTAKKPQSQVLKATAQGTDSIREIQDCQDLCGLKMILHNARLG